MGRKFETHLFDQPFKKNYDYQSMFYFMSVHSKVILDQFLK